VKGINWLAVAARGSAVVVALVAGASSFRHIAEVAIRYGEHPWVAYALPWSIDGLMVVATAAMIEDQRNNRRPRWSARLAFAFGVIASLGANIASAQPSIGARVVAAVPAVALLLAIEVLTRSGHPVVVPADTESQDPVLSADAPPEQPVAPSVPVPAEAALFLPRPDKSLEREPEGSPTVRKIRRPAAETRKLAAVLMTEHPGITKEEIAARLKITPRRLRAVLQSA
jgi:hypothetical protein